MTDTVISTWFVADGKADESVFPQVNGLRSSTPEFRAVYWHCILCFFASSRRFNRSERHIFLTNTDLPEIECVRVAEWLRMLDVEIVRLPITYRIPAARTFGNQFYILDIIKHASETGSRENFLVLDCDCIWMGRAAAMSEAISRYGCLTYTLDERDGHPLAESINGVSRLQLKNALDAWCQECCLHPADTFAEYLPYHGGEIFAASADCVSEIAAKIDSLWLWAQSSSAGHLAFREEAHFLSILYALLGYEARTAQPFIKRMWTNFRLRNVGADDARLPIWHLPSEKRRGFTRMFRRMKHVGLGRWMEMSDQEFARIGRELMGIPRRGVIKFTQDSVLKLQEHARLYVDHARSQTRGEQGWVMRREARP